MLRFVRRNFWQGFDWTLLGLFVVLVVGGLFNLWGMGEAVFPLFLKQFWFLIIGVAVLIAVSLVDYRIFKNYSPPALLVYGLAVILVFLSLSFSPIRGVSAWITLGGFTLEPSELAKISVLILLAKYFSQKHVEIYRIRHVLISGFYVAIPAFLIWRQPDLGTAFVFFAIWLAMLLAAGIQRKHLLAILILTVAAGALTWLVFLEPYQKDRLSSFLNPHRNPRGEGYSAIQSQIAIGSGGWWGKGWGEGGQARLGFLPEAHTDFAFAAFLEQFGMARALSWFGLLAWLFWRVGQIGFEAENNFAKLFSIGFLSMIFFHFVINVGMNLGLLPITGLSLPFLSYGGSLLFSLAIGLGLVESFKIHRTP